MDFPDASDFLEVLFHSSTILPENATNIARFADPELDHLLDAARVELEPGARAALYRRAEARVREACPWIFHYHPIAVELRQPWVQNYVPHPVWLRDYRRVWLGSR